MMNKTAIKNFAIEARKKLLADVASKMQLLGITENGIAKALRQSTAETEFYDIGSQTPYAITGNEIAQRKSLVEHIQLREKSSNYVIAYRGMVEEVAYTWFNRLIAIRFMEVNDYIPSHIRVLSSDSKGKIEPDLVTTPFESDLLFSEKEKEQIIRMKRNHQMDDLFRLLFIKQCNALNDLLPKLFERTADYTELLLTISVADRNGVVYHLVNDIPEEDFNVEQGGQVEIIGWLYQYYNTELKDETFALLKKNVKITKERIPSATQLFTPDWIVRYMVENSLGRLWLEGHPNADLQAGWKYYLEEAEQEEDVKKQLEELRKERKNIKPEEITVMDPCMGSGHILVYAFDVLMQIYESVGYNKRDAANSIVENNLYGLEIDERAFQLAYFAVMMKGRQYDRRFLTKGIQPHVHVILESNSLDLHCIDYFTDGRKNLKSAMKILLEELHDAKEYGSILNISKVDFDALYGRISEIKNETMPTMYSNGVIESILPFTRLAQTLNNKYDVVVTNPPYMGNMPVKMTLFVQEYYEDAKYDLYAVFIEKALNLIKRNGYAALITQHSWMFISSFEKLRSKLMSKNYISLLHLGTRAFEEIGGEVVQTVSMVIRNSHVDNNIVIAHRLVDYTAAENKERAYLNGKNLYLIKQQNFDLLPGKPVVYWLTDTFFKDLKDGICLDNFVVKKAGVVTGNDNYFLRLWYEANYHDISFNGLPYNNYGKYHIMSKGGSARRFYGNYEYVIRLRDLYDIRKTNVSVRRGDKDYYFKKAIGWSQVGNAQKTFRTVENSVCGTATPTIYLKDNKLYNYVLGFLNTKIAFEYLTAYNPTINLLTTDICNLPLLISENFYQEISTLVDRCVSLSLQEWDSFETSWDFKAHPLAPLAYERKEQLKARMHSEERWKSVSLLSDRYERWELECENRFKRLKENEEELNRIFIDIYGLQDELTPDVEDKDVTVRKADKQRDIRSLISYAVGCMFGRYSLDTAGLAYAGGEWEANKYQTFIPDNDNVIPITDEEYFEDDIVGLFCAWLKKVYGKDTLEDNLDYIAEALGNRGNTSREVIRNYFLNDFFKDHCKIYQKRPIYWLFDSGKQNGFKALIYLHRYNADTIGNLRAEYLHRMEHVYESGIAHDKIVYENSNNAREQAKAEKHQEKLQKQLKECREYDERLAYLALSRIELDLDDGVKVNYEKVQTGNDGKKYQVLAKIG